MDRFDAMQVFVRVTELKSFTKAAEALQLPRATVTHAVQQLEQRLGTRLLHRTTRQVSATLDGEAYYQRCLRLLADVEEAEAVFGQVAAKPRGKLRVDLQGTLAQHFLLPHLGEFCERYPDIELEIGLGDRLSDLVRESIDCVLRAGEPRDSSMVGRRVARLEQLTCASAGYLARHGEPLTPEDLLAQGHRAVNYLGSGGKALPFDFIAPGSGERLALQLPGTVLVSSAEAYAMCCEAGLGLVQLPRYHVVRALAEGRLREVLADWRPAPMPVSVLYPHQRQLSQRVRVFVDWVAERMHRSG